MSKDTSAVQGNATPKFLSVTQSAEGLVFALGNGKTIAVSVATMPAAIREQAMLHGFKQKIADSVAGLSKGEKYAEAYAELADVVSSLAEGEWFRRGGGNGGQIVQDLIAAIAKLKKSTVERVAVAVAKADEETRKGWMKNPAIAAEMAELKAKRLKAASREAEQAEVEIDLGA